MVATGKPSTRVAANRVQCGGARTRERGLQLFQPGNGLRSVASPRHFPIAEARRIKLERVAARKALAKQAAEVASHIREARALGIILPRRIP
jgi:hypothetical protein